MKKEMVGNVPGNILGMFADLAHKLQHGVITEYQFGRFLQKQNPFDTILGSVNEQLSSWRQFYLDEFSIELGEIEIPERRSGFDRLIVVAQGITSQQVYDQCQRHFQCWKYTDKNLDKVIVRDDRSSQKGTYAVWIHDRIEADEELRSLSVNELKKKNIQGITLAEHLLYGLKYFTETDRHLDIENVTLCTGSRCGGGHVPDVGWGSDDRGMYVGWYGSDSAGDALRTREVVS